VTVRDLGPKVKKKGEDIHQAGGGMSGSSSTPAARHEKVREKKGPANGPGAKGKKAKKKTANERGSQSLS